MFTDRILKVENVGHGKTAIITPPLGPTYDKFTLYFVTEAGPIVLAAADLSEVRIKVNDVETFNDTGTRLNNRQAYKGISTDAAEVCLDFTEPHARGDAAQQYLASIPSNLCKKLVIEADIAAGAANVSGAAMFATAEFRGPTQNPFILKRRKFNQVLGAAGDHDLFLPAGYSGGIIKRVWLHRSANNITAALLRVGGFIAKNYKTIAELQREQVRNGLTPQANIDVLDFIQDGNLQGALNTAAGKGGQAPDVALRLTTDGALTVTGYVDFIDPLDRVK